ncbi:MAG: iron-containing alcohol dehydrogenase [Elusimicrobia bacterium]|nr:iron-containing alcohol dehydrogenase [Elusimicrobiota bacterium]
MSKDFLRFHTPKFVYFGSGCLEMVKEGIVVSSPSVWENFRKKISKIDSEPILFERSSPTGEPTEEDVLELVAALGEKTKERSGLPVVAIGGGSVIDATKLALQFSASPEMSFERIYSKGPTACPKNRLIGIETTSGTGTGVTAVAVVMRKDKIKRGIFGFNLICDEAYYDPDLVETAPREVFANASMDALTHAIESFTSRIENVAADAVSLKAIELIGENIVAGFNGERSAREKVHYGNMLAGMGFSNARLGICHALAHLIGGRFDIPHGKINAMLLPSVVEFNESATNKFDDIAAVLNIKRDEISKWVASLDEELGIPPNLVSLGDEFRKMIPLISQETLKSSLMAPNPRRATVSEIREFLEKAAV